MTFNKPGMISPILEEPKYVSERNMPLVTQYIGDEELCAHLTVENYMKWYSVYLIHANGIVEEIIELEDPNHGSYYKDHAFNPDSFHKTAVKLGARYDDRTFALVCERWVEDALDGDWRRLAKYLPTESDSSVLED